MNSLEKAYAAILEERRLAGEVDRYRFDEVKLRLADKTYYTPDFFVVLADGSVEIHEVKGFWEDDARVKIKVAAERFEEFKFIAVTRKTKKAGGGWEREEF